MASAPPSLKIFGIHVTHPDPHLGQLDSSTSTAAAAMSVHDVRKYECQYCRRQFLNSQALGGHQNAHKKERQQVKRAATAAATNCGSYSFPSAAAVGNLVYLIRPTAPLHVSHTYPFLYADNGGAVGGPLVGDVSGGGDDACGVDLHLSLGTGGSPV